MRTLEGVSFLGARATSAPIHLCGKCGKVRPPLYSPPLPPPGHWANVQLTDLWWSLTPAHAEYLRVVQSVREFPGILQGNYHFQPCLTSCSLTQSETKALASVSFPKITQSIGRGPGIQTQDTWGQWGGGKADLIATHLSRWIQRGRSKLQIPRLGH